MRAKTTCVFKTVELVHTYHAALLHYYFCKVSLLVLYIHVRCSLSSGSSVLKHARPLTLLSVLDHDLADITFFKYCSQL